MERAREKSVGEKHRECTENATRVEVIRAITRTGTRTGTHRDTHTRLRVLGSGPARRLLQLLLQHLNLTLLLVLQLGDLASWRMGVRVREREQGQKTCACPCEKKEVHVRVRSSQEDTERA